MNKNYSDIFNLNKQNKMRNFFLEVLCPKGQLISYDSGSIVSLDIDDSMYIISEGEAQISLYEESGEEQLIYTLRPGELLGEFEIFSDISQSYILYFIKDSKICKIKKTQVFELLKISPDYYKYFIHSMSRKYNIALFQLSFNKFYVNEEKILEFLIRLCITVYPDKEENIEVDGYTHENIGNSLNISRIGVTNILKKLEKNKLILVKRRLIIVLSLERLKEYRSSVYKD